MDHGVRVVHVFGVQLVSAVYSRTVVCVVQPIVIHVHVTGEGERLVGY